MDTPLSSKAVFAVSLAGATFLLLRRRRAAAPLPKLTNPASEHFSDGYEEARAAFGAAVGALEASASKLRLKSALDASRANVSQALVAAAPVAADVEAALRRCSREVYEAVAPACLEIAAQVKPRVAAAAAAAAARAKQAWQTVEAAIVAWEAAVARALGKDESPR